MTSEGGERTVARLLVECLEHEGVEYVFGSPGEENLHTIDALADSSIRFITTRDERGASFMADTYGALTGRPGVCLATLGPGAINLMLGIAGGLRDHAGLYQEFRGWVVDGGGGAVGAALQTPPFNVVVARPAAPGALEALVAALSSERQKPPGVTAALCGAKRPEQIRANAGGMGWRLTDPQRAQIAEALALRGTAASRGAVS